MLRKIIKINEDLCNGCGACATACHEGAIGMINGKAKLLREDYCDGLGDCLPACPTGAISFEEREAPAYDEAAVQKNKQATEASAFHGCPGSQMRQLHSGTSDSKAAFRSYSDATASKAISRLAQWPVQLQLVPVHAPYFDGAKLLIAADCTAYAYAGFHDRFMKGHVTLIGCPKLDSVEYSRKLAEIIQSNNIQSVTVLRMEVPCCGGIEAATKAALQNSGKFLPWQVVTLSIDGNILN